jgi:DNA repair exonuclease SbcCD ATPase subunit
MSVPLIFKKIQFRNVGSFGNQMTEIDLTYSGSTHIHGENVDQNSNNGAGKTTIINTLCYGIYNKPFDNISLQRLINRTNDTKNTLMEVRIFFEKGDDEYEIYRCRGETFNIQVMKNGDDITLDSVGENDKLVEEIIGMSYDLFTKIIIFSGASIPFFLMAVAQQRQQIEELFNITLLSEKAVKLKEIIKATEGSIAIQAALIKEHENQATLHQKQVSDAENRVARWYADTNAQIEALYQQLEKFDSADMDDEKELHALVDQLEKDLAPKVGQLRVLDKDRKTIGSDVKKLSDEVHHLVDEKCPYCLQQYAAAGDRLIDKQKHLENRQQKLAEVEELFSLLEEDIRETNNQISTAKSIMVYSSLAEAIRAESTAQGAMEKIAQLEAATNPHIEALDALKSQVVTGASHDELDNLKRELEHQQFLLKLLTDKNSFIRKNIINRTIPFLNSRLIHYTKELGLPHVVKFDPDMSCTVSEYGRELDYGNLSGGEKKRVNLALSLAFRDVLHHLHARVNCLFIDEIDASLDAPGVEASFKLLKQKSRDEHLGLWIISHRPEAVGRFDRNLIVRKENGFSRIIDEHEETV